MIVLTGATGNIGSKLTTKLLDAGMPVRLYVHHAEKAAAFAARGAEIVEGDIKDAASMAAAFAGADVVFTLIPGDWSSQDFGALQDTIGFAIIDAIRASGVKKVLNISSLGGHTDKGTGVVAGLARQETRLAALRGVDVLTLRPSYFMENLLGSIGMIKTMGINGSAIRDDVPMPIVATQDIADVAFAAITNFTTQGYAVQPLHGARDYTMNEITRILGTAIGKPDLPYVTFPAADAIAGFMQMGTSQSVATLYIELMLAINDGILGFDARTPESTTPTTIEQFSQIFAAVYNA